MSDRESLYGFLVREQDQRREPEREVRSYDIKQMWQVHHEIVNLSARGFKNVDIAKILGISPTTVSNTLNSQLGEQKLADIRESRDEEAKVVSERIRVLTDKALSTYNEIFDNENCTVKEKMDAANTVLLELSGLRVPTKVQNSFTSTLSKEAIAELKQRGLDAMRAAGLIIDITPETPSPMLIDEKEGIIN